MPALPMSEIARDYVTDGVPSSGKHTIRKADLRTWGTWIEDLAAAFLASGGRIYSSKTSLDGDLAHPVNTMAWVVGDDEVGNNGIYRKTGGSGSGSWIRVADLPYSFIVAIDDGAGTPNAIQATSSIPVSGAALVLLNVLEANTASPVTVSFNGGAPLTIKTNSGNDVVVGGLTAEMVLAGRVSGTTFRLISDQASAAIIAEAEALLLQMQGDLEAAIADLVSQTETIRDEAQAAADDAAFYAEMVGAAAFDFNFDIDPETPGLDWNE